MTHQEQVSNYPALSSRAGFTSSWFSLLSNGGTLNCDNVEARPMGPPALGCWVRAMLALGTHMSKAAPLEVGSVTFHGIVQFAQFDCLLARLLLALARYSPPACGPRLLRWRWVLPWYLLAVAGIMGLCQTVATPWHQPCSTREGLVNCRVNNCPI